MRLIERLKKLLPDKKITVEKNRIVVKNIDNSLVYINPLDKEDLAELRQEIKEDQEDIFDQLIQELVEALTPKIKHFFRIAELKTATENHRFLFENNLAFFTPEEIKGHIDIVHNIQEARTALLLGFPATGKSIAVITISERLAIAGYRTYYFSFKKMQHWPDLWEEMLTHADDKTVFVLDDIHLQPEQAGTTLNRLRHKDNLNILFISREVYANRQFVDTLNIYKELKAKTVRTEQPSIDEKVKGIISKYQAYYQAQNNKEDSYVIGDWRVIIQRVHRNLVVLNAYLKFWEKYPELKLAELEEATLYKDIYATYFAQQALNEEVRIPLLQYLCLYYFEIEFYQNPQERAATQLLVEKAAIIQEEEDLYSIYHGEYAFLLLKAFRFVKARQFKRMGGDWQNFFFRQIKAYLLGFKISPAYAYPDNLLEILTAIPRFTKEVQGGVKNTKAIILLYI